MKKLYPYFCLVFVLALVVPAYAGQGNGAPSGPHYNLNIIGVQKEKSADMYDNNGHRIFVNLEGKSKIMLSPGEDFRVIDANGTKGSAEFQLPIADADNDGITEYSVWARALGKPGGTANITTCASDLLDAGEMVEWCTMHILTMRTRERGNKLTDISRHLLYIYADLDSSGTPERYPLFDDALQGYFWDYDNAGLKIAQFRFYEIPTDEPDPMEIEQP